MPLPLVPKPTPPPLHAERFPGNSHPAPSPAPGQIPPLTPTAPTPQARARGTRGPSTIWTIGFTTLCGLILVLSLAGSAIAFNITQPYGTGNPAGLDHAVELGLS